jgi:hypothetical protein
VGRGRLKVERQPLIWRKRGGREQKDTDLMEGRGRKGGEVEHPVGRIYLSQRCGIHWVGSLWKEEPKHGGGEILGLRIERRRDFGLTDRTTKLSYQVEAREGEQIPKEKVEEEEKREFLGGFGYREENSRTYLKNRGARRENSFIPTGM